MAGHSEDDTTSYELGKVSCLSRGFIAIGSLWLPGLDEKQFYCGTQVLGVMSIHFFGVKSRFVKSH